MVIKNLEQWVKELRQSKKLVLVEGPKDKRALEQCGLKRIAVLSKYALYKTAELIAEQHASVVILTDLDKKGKALYGALKKQLQQLGVKVDTQFREYLLRETDLSHIEGLHTYMNNTVKRNGTSNKKKPFPVV